MNIGILGGTFDPIHNGHIRLAELAYEQFDLDEVWLMPAPVPPFKPDSCTASYADRLRMTELAVAGHRGMLCSDFESQLNRSERSYTADTVSALSEKRPDDSFSLILGADSFFNIDTWYRPDIIFDKVDVIVAVRRYDNNHLTLQQTKAYLEEKYGARIYFIDSQEYDVSSTQIKLMLARNESIHGMVPEAVVRYIREHSLYL